jgi:hypothetical protein
MWLWAVGFVLAGIILAKVIKAALAPSSRPTLNEFELHVV